MKSFWRLFVVIMSVSCFPLSSCSSNRSTVTTETRSVGSEGNEKVEVTKTEENTDKESNSCAGVLSCTVDFLGDVIAFPFRLVGGLVQAVF